MTDRGDGQTHTLGETFCLKSTQSGFVAGLVAAGVLTLWDSLPHGVASGFAAEALGFAAIAAVIAIALMTLQLMRGVRRGGPDRTFWGASGFVSAVLICALVRATAMHAGLL